MLSKRVPIEELEAAMARQCFRLTDGELTRTLADLSDKIEARRLTRWYRVARLLPWDTGAEWRLRELFAVRRAVIEALESRKRFADGVIDALDSYDPAERLLD